jgi:hypothetical protein
VKIFNERIHNMIANDSWIFSVAALGSIEYCYITASKNIHNYAKHFLPTEKITHYSLHETMDVKHVTDLFSIIEERWEVSDLDGINPTSEERYRERDRIVSGLRFGYFCLDKLYREMSEFLPGTTHVD